VAESVSQVASGVQELIAKLRSEGVDAGRQEAARILEDAHRRAEEIVESAQREAADTVGIARATAQAELRAMREALRVAQRDTVLALKEELTALLRDRLQALIAAHLASPDGLQAVLNAALSAIPSGGAAGAELIASPQTQALAQSALQPVLQQLLDRGATLRAGVPHAAGVRLRLGDQGVELDLTDEALTELLAARLMGRFHALLDGHAP
jgi:V/A-type H+-transporting ATPase subunit E